jgi:sugar/nucleoside kinase (ribokinase family)
MAESTSTQELLGPVVCIGVHILDIHGRPVSEIPPGQNSLIIDEIRITAAGTAAGTSVDLAKLGARVLNMGAVGDDDMGDLVLTLLERHGVATDLITRKAQQRTSATILPIRPNGERPALHAVGANADFVRSDLTSAHLAALGDARLIHVGGPDSLTGFDPVELAECLEDARRGGASVTMDVLHRGSAEGLDRLAPLLSQVDWFLPNDDQLRSFTGCDDLVEGMKVIRGLGARGVAVTLGEAGCLVDDGTSVASLPAMKVSVVDTTGCGDGFDAGFITGLLRGLRPLEAAWLGTICGGLVATGLGSDAGIESWEQVLGILEGLSGHEDARSALEALRGIHR